MTVVDYPALKAQLAALRQQMRATAKDYFRQAVTAVFAEHPKLRGFGWQQYTPYYNDGDECVFRAGTSIGDLEYYFGELPPGEDDEAYDDYDPEESEYAASSYGYFDVKYEGGKFTHTPRAGADPATVGAMLAAGRLMEVFEDEDLQEMFGNHVRVLVTREGARVEEYEHD